ncbi:MAG: alpha/beta family hydrolase [Acidimicrobiia bacterium]
MGVPALSAESSDGAQPDDGYRGPKRGADRAVLLAHGAGADMHAKALTVVADALAAAGIPSLRFDFPYRSAGRRAPDRAPVLGAAVRDAAVDLARRSKVSPERLVLGGRSMGGRIASIVVAEGTPALGLALLGYPLHPPGRPDQLRVEHFARLEVPVLFVSGTRDAFGTPTELRRHAKKVKGPLTWSWVDTGDHSFKPLKASGITAAAALDGVGDAVVEFVTSL